MGVRGVQAKCTDKRVTLGSLAISFLVYRKLSMRYRGSQPPTKSAEATVRKHSGEVGHTITGGKAKTEDMQKR